MTRLVGLDLFRAIAVFGMLVAHVGPAAWTAGDGLGTVHWQWEVFHSRMPAMFAFAAGLSLTLGGRSSNDRATLGARSGGRTTADPTSPVAPTLVRAALLAACGGLLTALGTPVVVILASFGLWFALVTPFLRLGARPLFLIAGAWAVLGPPLSFVLRSTLPAAGPFTNAGPVAGPVAGPITGPVTDAGELLWSGLVSGDYPALTWMPFVLAGLATGRLDLSSARIRVRLGAVGAGLATLAYGGSALFLATGGSALLQQSIVPADGLDTAQQFARIFFRESGVTDTGSWLWLLTPAPHSGSWADVLGCLGVAALLLAVLLPLGDRLSTPTSTGTDTGSLRVARVPRIPRILRIPLRAVAASGAMVLSVYAAHIVAMAVITAVTGHSFRGAQSVWMLLAFTAALVAFAALWLARFRRGPIEELLARTSALIVRTGRRASGGSSRR
ncbi:peptidoglycan/LPS O-acetylase OafA/YrhL [Microbacterium resistens]|uniref:Peptidoglycan/LPS O-acetylase OafA/YrhL n=1 Tax=Microbacterium resistens TaxID=156977 RepID=A0ABU1SDV7_9MICO|nr:heparan-alpha-glucosaminide N-acetyltransferase domain-containing protein [Microbacterium resistens]MDR6867067.1 peptidoglycan/LPS O-acetylase OafA/YrhL [Microbacterium resistens]